MPDQNSMPDTEGQQQDGDLDHAMALLTQTGALNAARDEAFSWAEKARAALSVLPDHPLRQTLSDLTHYVVSRVS